MDDKKTKDEDKTPETVKDLKEQANDADGVKKGYNESNPAQEEGAFKPDNDNDKSG